jgi:hypothetical protein
MGLVRIRSEARSTRTEWQFSLPVPLAIVAVVIRILPALRADIHFAFPAASVPYTDAAYGPHPWRAHSAGTDFEPGVPRDDSFEYLELADGLRSGCGFARRIDDRCAPPEILRTPGYPLFLTLMPNVRSILVAQAAMAGVGCLLIAWWVALCWNVAAAIVAEFIFALDLPSFVLSSQVMSEALFQLLLLIALVLPLVAMSKRAHIAIRVLVAVVAAAFAILVRPTGLVLPFLMPMPFLLAGTIEWRKRIVPAAATFAIPMLVLVGWSARNYFSAGYFGVSALSAINLYFYRAADVEARIAGTSLEAMQDELGSTLGLSHEHAYDADKISPKIAARMQHLARTILLAHPLQVGLMTIRSIAYVSLTPVRSQLARVLDTPGASKGSGLNAGALSMRKVRNVLSLIMQSPPLASLIVFQIAMSMFLWIGIGKALIRSFQGTVEYRMWVVCLLVASFFLLVLPAGGEAEARFRTPAIPLLAIVSGLGYFPRPWRLEHVHRSRTIR